MGGKKIMRKPIHGMCLIAGIDRTEINDGTEVLSQHYWMYRSDIKVGKTKRFLF